MTIASTTIESKASTSVRWGYLAICVICMVMIANLQYGWNLFVDPIDAKFHWGRAAIQVAFTLFVLTETWLVPIEGWFVDNYGPRIVVMSGGLLVTLAWIIVPGALAPALPVDGPARGGGIRQYGGVANPHHCRRWRR